MAPKIVEGNGVQPGEGLEAAATPEVANSVPSPDSFNPDCGSRYGIDYYQLKKDADKVLGDFMADQAQAHFNVGTSNAVLSALRSFGPRGLQTVFKSFSSTFSHLGIIYSATTATPELVRSMLVNNTDHPEFIESLDLFNIPNLDYSLLFARSPEAAILHPILSQTHHNLHNYSFVLALEPQNRDLPALALASRKESPFTINLDSLTLDSSKQRLFENCVPSLPELVAVAQQYGFTQLFPVINDLYATIKKIKELK